MALGSMSYGDARLRAKELNTAASNMDEIFVKLKKEMDSLETVLRSKGADDLYATYRTLEAKISSFPNKVRDFRGFLLAAVEQYEADDASLSSEIG